MAQIPLFNSSNITNESLVHFTITKQVTLTAFGMKDGEYITFEMVALTSPQRPANCDPCELPPVTMPEALAWQALMCCGGCNGFAGEARLSNKNPVVVLDSPTETRMRAVYHGHNFASAAPFEVLVQLQESDIGNVSEGMRGCCPPVEAPVAPPPNYCPSFRIEGSCESGCMESGFMYRNGDVKDPDATVQITACDGSTAGWIYPTAGVGHTIPYYDGGSTVVGYLQNRSACAPDVSPVINNYVTTNVGAPNITLPAPNVVALQVSPAGVVTATLDTGATVVSNEPASPC